MTSLLFSRKQQTSPAPRRCGVFLCAWHGVDLGGERPPSRAYRPLPYLPCGKDRTYPKKTTGRTRIGGFRLYSRRSAFPVIPIKLRSNERPGGAEPCRTPAWGEGIIFRYSPPLERTVGNLAFLWLAALACRVCQSSAPMTGVPRRSGAPLPLLCPGDPCGAAQASRPQGR